MPIRQGLEKWLLVAGVAILVAFPAGTIAQSSANLPIGEPEYRAVEKLAAFGLAASIHWGHRPFTRMQIARMIVAAEDSLRALARAPVGGADGDWRTDVERLLDALRPMVAEEVSRLRGPSGDAPRVTPLNAAYVYGTIAESPPRTIPPNDIGDIDAVINPLLQNREGRRLVHGGTLAVETAHHATLGDRFTLSARPRVQLGIARDSPDVNELVLQQLSARLTLGNLAITAGRDAVHWGMSRHGGLVLSGNARGLDMIHIGNDRAIRLPWIFRLVGPTKLSALIADLGPNQTFPHALLIAYKMSVKPWRTLELGGSIATHIGGDGAPSGSPGDYVKDIIPFFENIFGPSRISNKVAGIDFRLTVPGWRGASVFGEAVLDDIELSRIRLLASHDTGYILGVIVPRLTASGSADLGIEIRHTSTRLYRHNQFLNGLTLDQFVLGDALGPDATGAYATLGVQVRRRDRVEFAVSVEGRSNDNIVWPSFERTIDTPDEYRIRGLLSWTAPHVTPRLTLQVQLGGERVTNFAFAEGSSRTNGLAEMVFRYQP